MTRFQKLALATVVMTVFLVTIGVVVRATDSGMGCPDWPLCHGQLIPPLDDPKAWIEWVHRTVAAVIGFMILGVAYLAWKDHRHQRSILIPSIAAVLLVGFQAWLGRETVRLNNSGESVTAHLAAAMALLGLLVYVTIRAFYPAKIEGRGASQRFTLLAAFSAIATYALLLFGSHVTAQDAALVFTDWPLMNGVLIPIGPDTDAVARPLYEAHALHRYVAVIVGLITWATAWAAWRTQRDHPTLVRLALADRDPVPDPGDHRRAAGPDPAGRVDADAAPRARGGHLGARRGARGRGLLRGTRGDGAGGERDRGRRNGQWRRRARGSSRGPAATPSVPTSR